MFKRSLLLAAVVAAVPLFADEGDPVPAPAAPVVMPDGSAVLRGIGRVTLEVVMSDGVRAEDTELRTDLRDTLELELRRAGVRLADSNSGSPVLRLTVKFDRGAGRYAARLILSVKDQVIVTRSRESIVAEIWTAERGASAALDTALSREIRSRARDLSGDFTSALRKANGLR